MVFHICIDNVYLLIHLREAFFDTNVGSRPNLARMCGWSRDWLSPKQFDPPHPILIDTRSYRRPLYRRPEAVVDKSAMRRFASLFGEVLLYQHQRIVTMTKVYIASKSIHVEKIRFHIIKPLVTFESRQQRAHCYPRRVATVLSRQAFR